MQVKTVSYTSYDAPQQFCQSLKDTGFAVLTHHPVPVSLIEETYQTWRHFFLSENKFNYTYQKPSQDGYFPLLTEKAKNRTQSDLKEFYHFYPWGKMPEETKEISLLMCQALTQLAAELLRWVESYLPQDISQKLSMPLSQMIENSPNTLLRILHYPPLDIQFEKGAERAAPHEDINLITLLPAATSPGLEVLNTKNEWYPIDCDPGNIVVNVGDMLALCTQQYYKSTTHRVTNPDKNQNISRFSMPLFLHPHPDVYLSENCKAESYLHERLAQIGIY